MAKTLLTLSVLATGLMAGLFSAFSYAVMPGLRNTDDVAFVSSMRGINKAILVPIFGILFGGALILLAASLIALRHNAGVRPWVALALLLYVLTLLVTMAVNVPLNNGLETGSGSAESLREAFESRWVGWNAIRALLNTGAFAAAAVALLRL
ncbi:anthrone oxygenase family protein [Micromonospora sp. NPDC049645]|uniref:anthrone oxygenase family protein n=1 Tax=Micromonospora sp. NPDC049645 TaxID=3155508 RepID=UPI003420332B